MPIINVNQKCDRCEHEQWRHAFNGIFEARGEVQVNLGRCLYCDCACFVGPFAEEETGSNTVNDSGFELPENEVEFIKAMEHVPHAN